MFKKFLVVMVLGVFAASANAASTTLSYTGTIDVCPALCIAFMAGGGTVNIDADITFPDGGGTVSDVSNVSLSVLLLSGGVLEFVDGGALPGATLAVDGAGLPTSGDATLFATGATSMILAFATLFADGTFNAFLDPMDPVGTSIGSGSGSFSAAPIPVPAAIWFMGSALLGLFGIRRRA